MIALYRYSYGWREQKVSHNDDYVLGAKTKSLLEDKEQGLEILKLLQTQAEGTQAESMDIYFDETYTTTILTVKLFDDEDDLIKMFNVEHSMKIQEFILLLEFLEFNLEHDVNVYQYKGKVAENLTEDCDECYEIGRAKQVKIKPVR